MNLFDCQMYIRLYIIKFWTKTLQHKFTFHVKFYQEQPKTVIPSIPQAVLAVKNLRNNAASILNSLLLRSYKYIYIYIYIIITIAMEVEHAIKEVLMPNFDKRAQWQKKPNNMRKVENESSKVRTIGPRWQE